ncbi:MAG: hypothetical protein Q7W02_02385 [Candidatus Rokubacteria bacterium]|nr:hypothetical protein [Candidatus Rokubacteria bacterium]
MLEDMIRGIVAQLPGLPDTKKSQLALTLRGRGEDLERGIIEVLVRQYTVAEIEAQTRWQSSPEGRSIMSKMAAYTVDIGVHVQPILQAVIDEFLKP